MHKIALLLSVLALGLGAFALLKAPAQGRDAQTVALSSGDIDAVARRLNEEVQAGVKSGDKVRLGELDKRIKSIQELLTGATDSLQKAQSRAENTTNFNASKLEELEAMLGTINASYQKQEEHVEALAARLKAVEERPAAVAAAPANPGPVAPKPEPTAPKPDLAPQKPQLPNQAEDPAVVKASIDKAMADLDSEDPEKLYPAITTVAKRKVMEAVPKLIKVLGTHPEFFTRQAAVSALGDLRACDAVPALADALKDKSLMVAQQANKSLRLITEHDLGLSPQARGPERTKARADMLEWWSRHEDEVRTRLGQPKAKAEGK